jgi:hypothetical protein
MMKSLTLGLTLSTRLWTNLISYASFQVRRRVKNPTPIPIVQLFDGYKNGKCYIGIHLLSVPHGLRTVR